MCRSPTKDGMRVNWLKSLGAAFRAADFPATWEVTGEGEREGKRLCRSLSVETKGEAIHLPSHVVLAAFVAL